MAVSKENSSGSSQLQGLLDLLIDLQIVNSPQEFTKESPLSNKDAPSQGETSGSQSVEEYQDSGTNHDTSEVKKVDAPDVANDWRSRSPILEPEPKQDVPKNEPQTEAFVRAELEAAPDRDFSPKQDGVCTEKISPSPSHPLTGSPPHPLSSTSSLTEELALDDFLKAVENLPNQIEQSHPSQEQQEESKNQTVLSEVELNQPKNLDTPSEQQVFNQLIQSHWQKAQRQEYTRQSIAATDDLDNSITLFERWQRLLLTQEVMDSRQTIATFKKKLESLEHQIHEPTELTNLLLPLIAEILTLKVAESRQDIAQAIGPVVDEMIQHRAQQDLVALGSALAPVLSEAVVQQVTNSPGDLAKALGPEMGTAIKEQITLERDAMVDALYPVIGSTISKYMAEVVKSINEKVENTLSLEGISRKIRAKMQGVSEAELILKEAMPFRVQAIFLIHKASGLVISEVQPLDTQRLESEMVAGMLTAIRSFVNDCIAQSGNVSEIDQIEYGNSKIILEVAGYCYLAVVIQGEPPNSFINQMRKTLAALVQRHGKSMELFDGDPANVPEEVNQTLQALTELSQFSTETQKRKRPVALILVSLGVLTAIFLPLGINQHLSAIDRSREEKTNVALASDPELAVYRLMVKADRGTLKLSGRLPNQYLRAKAEQVARLVEPKLKIQNAIIPVVVPADPVTAQAEVKRVTDILNQMEGAVISADYSEGKVTVQGTVLQEADAKKVTQAFQQIPGVESVTNTVQLQPLAIASRIYFEQGSSELKSEEISKVSQIREFLKQYPNKQLQLLGHTDPKGTVVENEPLALERATKVRDALINQGVDPKRLQIAGTTNPPIGVKAEQLPLLSRCVEFKIITP